MSDKLIYSNILSIIAALRWQESKEGFCANERDNALRVILGLLNKVSNRGNFVESRRAVFALMNNAKPNLA